MAEHDPIYAPAVTADTIQYKPLSLFAVAGFSVGAFFALMILAFATDGLLRGQPFFLPTLLILVPLAGAVLSGMGLWEVQNSEGTRAGANLAKWGLALSLVFGIGYYVYQNVTGLAIIQQANRFLLEKDVDSGFFPLVQSNQTDLNRAFLFTLPPNERIGIRPESNADMERLDMPSEKLAKGPVSRFMDSYLVRVIRQAGPASVKIEPGAVKDWSYDNGTYKIDRTYRISTDDGSWEVPLRLTSTEPEDEGGKRKWRVDWFQLQPLQAVSRTEQGRKKQALRHKAYQFCMQVDGGYFKNLTQRRGFEIYLAEQRPQDRKELRQRAAALDAQTPLVLLAGTALPPLEPEQVENLRKTFLPGYQPLGKFADKVNTSQLRFLDPKEVDNIRTAIEDAFSLPKLPSLSAQTSEDELATYEVRNGEVTVKLPIDMMVIIDKKQPDNTVKSFGLKVIGTINVAAPDTLDPAAKNAEHEWRVTGLDLSRALPIIRQGPQQIMPGQ